MKIFAVYSNLKLTKKPAWLDDFRSKYNYPYDYHVTLKQPVCIQEDEVVNVEDILTRFFNELKFPDHRINIVFNKITTDTDNQKDESVIMINAEKNGEVNILQKKVVVALASYTNLYNPKSKNWEEDFKPHITIADELDSNQLKQAISEIGEDVRCEGSIEEIVLSVVKDMTDIFPTLEETNNIKNKTIYRL